jgi:hypothetical protein
MGVILDLRGKIDKAIADKKLDGTAIRGKIALQCGFLLSLVSPSTPDDPVKIDKLKKSAEAVIGIRF